MVFSDYTNAGLGLNPNQWSVGNMLNRTTINPTVDLSTVLDVIDNLPSAQAVRDAYTQIGPEKTGALGALALLNGNNLMRNLARRVALSRYFGPETPTTIDWRSALSFSGFPASKQQLMLAYDSGSLSGLITGVREMAPEKRWSLWIEPFGILGHQNTTINQTGYNFSIAGFTAGIDYRVRKDMVMGLATGYTHTSVSFKGSGGTSSNDTWPLAGYVAYRPESFYAFGSLGYSLNAFDLERKIQFGGLARTAKSSPMGHQFNAYAEVGYDLKMKPWLVTPTMSLSYSQIRLNSWTEKGADPLNLKVKAQTAESLQTGLGGKVAVPLKTSKVTVVPQVYGFYQHEFSNNSRCLNARLSQGIIACTWQTDKPQRNYALVGADVTLNFRKNMLAYLNYNAEVGRGNNTAQYINTGLRINF
jgi:outer membrane autotransporter protein